MNARGRSVLLLLLLGGGLPSAAHLQKTGDAAARAPVVISVPMEPMAVTGSDERVHLAYELHVTNFPADEGALRLERLEAYGVPATGLLAQYDASDLDGRVMHPGAERSARYGRSIEAGRHAVIHVWVALENRGPVPPRLRHRLVFRTDKGTDASVDGADVRVRPDRPIVFGPPIRGGAWLTHNGPGNHRSPHWGSFLALNGRVTVPQRFAVDFIGLDATGRAVRKDFQSSQNEDWVGFGAEVIAVADGVVRAARDGVPDNRPLAPLSPPASTTADGVYGNYVVLDVGANAFVHYAHFERNSVAVKTGQHVRRGQTLGKLGNSGNTNGAHLHFHVSDGATFENAEGLPFVIDSFELLGETSAERAIGAEPAEPLTPSPRRRNRELPLHGTVIRF
jgi:hypothetical protein